MSKFEQPVDTISNRLKYAMSVRGMNQADIITRTGIPSPSLSQYVSGQVSPKQNRIYVLAKVLSVNEAWLMGFDVPMDRDSVKVQQPVDYSAVESDVKILIECYSKLDTNSKTAVRELVQRLSAYSDK